MSSPIRVASWWARDYAYAANWQLRAFFSPHNAEEYTSGTRRPVVVIPGIWETWGFLRPLIEELHAAGHPVHVVRALGRNRRPIPDAARLVADLLAERDLRDVAIVAHSKGGLIGKYLMSEADADGRVTLMVAICTPFAGSIYARFMLAPSLREFSPRDPTTLQLQRTLEVNARITTISGVFDPHIPALWALEGATNVTLDTGGHFRPVSDPRTIRVVLDTIG